MIPWQDYFRQFFRRLFLHIDWPLFSVILMLMGIGLVTVYSASQDNESRLVAQLINFTVALVSMWIVAQFPPRALMHFAVPIYALGLVLLILVWLVGIKVNGARRWLDLGVARIQPAEIMKIAMPLILAWYFHKHESATNYRHFMVASLILIVPVAIIFKQPDLGTAILVGSAGFFVLYFAGLSWRFIVGFVCLCAMAAPFAWNFLHDYQKKRILTLLDPSTDPLGAGYHIIQATIAVGSGGKTGKGWLSGTQTHLEFIPEKHTDFIFAVFAEEWGLAGACVLIAIYLLFLARGLYITVHAPTLFSRLLAGAITLIFFIYAFVNMGMVTGILPVVGVPLPFISYGGTALVTLCIGAGMLMGVHTHHLRVKR